MSRKVVLCMIFSFVFLVGCVKNNHFLSPIYNNQYSLPKSYTIKAWVFEKEHDGIFDKDNLVTFEQLYKISQNNILDTNEYIIKLSGKPFTEGFNVCSNNIVLGHEKQKYGVYIKSVDIGTTLCREEAEPYVKYSTMDKIKDIILYTSYKKVDGQNYIGQNIFGMTRNVYSYIEKVEGLLLHQQNSSSLTSHTGIIAEDFICPKKLEIYCKVKIARSVCFGSSGNHTIYSSPTIDIPVHSETKIKFIYVYSDEIFLVDGSNNHIVGRIKYTDKTVYP